MGASNPNWKTYSDLLLATECSVWAKNEIIIRRPSKIWILMAINQLSLYNASVAFAVVACTEARAVAVNGAVWRIANFARLHLGLRHEVNQSAHVHHCIHVRRQQVRVRLHGYSIQMIAAFIYITACYTAVICML